MVQFIAISIIVFLVVILSMVTMLLVAKRFLSPSGNVNIEINGDKTITVPQGSSLMATRKRHLPALGLRRQVELRTVQGAGA